MIYKIQLQKQQNTVKLITYSLNQNIALQKFIYIIIYLFINLIIIKKVIDLFKELK